jgi:hypothetical protein
VNLDSRRRASAPGTRGLLRRAMGWLPTAASRGVALSTAWSGCSRNLNDQETSPTPHHGLSSVGSVVGTGVVPNSTLDACCGVRSILQIDANTRVAHWLCVESVVVVDDSVSGLGGGREGGLVGQVASPTLIMIHFRPLPQLQTSLKPMNP